MALPAELPSLGYEKRGSDRKALRLTTQVLPEGAERSAIYDISETGMLLRLLPGMVAGDAIEVDLPHAGVVRANIVWISGGLCGCNFEKRISRAAVGAALLRSPGPTVVEPDVDQAVGESTEINSDPIDSYSPRTKIAVILGITSMLWALILSTAYILV